MECLETLCRLDYDNFEIIVVDNNSTDGTVKEIRACFPNVRCYQSDENSGFTGGYNMGIECASRSEPDYYFLINNDTTLEPKTLATLVQTMEQNPEIGIASPQVLQYQNPKTIWAAGGKISSALRSTQHLHVGAAQLPLPSAPFEVDYLPGCSLLIRSNLIEEVGFFDDRFFAYGEDVEYCMRVSERGYKLVCVPASRLWHKCSNSSERVKPLVLYYYFRNNLIIAGKDDSLFRYVRYCYHFYRMIRLSGGLVMGWVLYKRAGALTNIKAMLSGFADYFRGHLGKKSGLAG